MAIVLANVDKIVTSSSKEFVVPEVDSPQEGDVIVYDEVNKKWKNVPKSAASGTSKGRIFFIS